MSLMTFNQSPYFDDFQASKGYMKILFKSGVPVQGRELNQIQSIFQNQITQFANNIFKNGSVVSGGRNSMKAQAYVRLKDYVTGSTTETVDITQFAEGFSLKGETSGVTATFIIGFNNDGTDPATIYVVYKGIGLDGKQSTFIPGETVDWLDVNNVVVYKTDVRCPTCTGSTETDTVPPIGSGQIYTVDDGVFYYEGMFLPVNRQMIIVTRYLLIKTDSKGNVVIDSTTLSDGTIPPPTCKIGLDLVQSIVTYQDDPTLLDPSLGYPNSTAPGADRYKCQLVLTKRGYTDADGDNFICLCQMGSMMSINYQAQESQYAAIQDDIARQFYETNGNYTLAPFKISFYESQKGTVTDAQGWSVDGDPDSLVCLVQPSTAYVCGYRRKITNPTPIQFPKSRDTKSIGGYINQFPERTYMLWSPTTGQVYPNDDADVSMMGTRLISLFDSNNVLIATCYVNDIRLDTPATQTSGPVYRYYIYDLQVQTGQVITSAAVATTDTGFNATVVPDPTSQAVTVYNPNAQALIYEIKKTNIKTLRSGDNIANGSLTVTVRQKLSGVLDANGTITFSATTNQAFLPNDAYTIIYVLNNGTYTVVDPTIAGVYTSDGTSLVIDTSKAGGGSNWASLSIYVLASVLYTSQKEKQKVLTAGTYTPNTPPDFTSGSQIVLPNADVQSVTVTWVQSGGTNTDITDQYDLEVNSNDYSYGDSYLTRNTGPVAGQSVNPADRLQITYNYYDWSGSQGWITVDSYPVDPATNPSATNDPVDYVDLPSVTLTDGDIIPVSQAIDFRPEVPSPYAEGDNTIQAMLPAMNSTAIFDIAYYLGRTDLLQINKDGILYIKLGTSSETPVPPSVDNNAMGLWNIILKPYVYSLSDVTTKQLSTQVYTMSDIGDLEERISNLEYYTALNLLEQSAATMQVTDTNGLNRFKNGFIADNFTTFQAADVTNPEFRCASDPVNQQLRPQFKARNKKLVVDPTNTSGFQIIGNVAIANYTTQQLQGNPYATTSVSINPYLVYNQVGTMQLSPNNDTWSTSTALPKITVTANSGMDSLTGVTDPDTLLGAQAGLWSQQNTTIQGAPAGSGSNFQSLASTSTAAQTSTTTTASGSDMVVQQSTKSTTTVASTTQSYSYDSVKDVSIVPYMRSVKIQFYAQKLRPSTILYAFFNGQDVSKYCTPFAASFTSSAELLQGSQLVSDVNGECAGYFTIPANTFFTGTATFILTDDPTGQGNPDVETTSATAEFFSGGLSMQTQEETVNVITPTQITTNDSTVATTVNLGGSATAGATPGAATSPAQGCNEVWHGSNAADASSGQANFNATVSLVHSVCQCATYPNSPACKDPVAQAFQTDSEMFLTGVGIFFEAIDPASTNMYLEIRTMDNGYPSSTVVAKKSFSVSDLNAQAIANNGPKALPYSSDSTVESVITFDTPVYLAGSTVYCFVVGGYSPNTRLYEAYLGQPVINNPSQIVQTTPTGQPSFRSLNASTWSAQQYETLKYNLYQAQFATGTLTLAFTQSAADDEKNQFDTYPLRNNPLQMQSGSNYIRVFARDHGFTEGDSVTLSMYEKAQITFVSNTNTPPVAGQLLIAGSASASIYTVQSGAAANEYAVTLSNVNGSFDLNSATDTSLSVTVPAVQGVTFRDPTVATQNGSQLDLTTGWTLPVNGGTVARGGSSSVTNGAGTIFPQDNFGGVPLSELNAKFTISSVDSEDTFIIQVDTPSNFTGVLGGNQASCLNFNEKYDIFNVAGSYMAYNATEQWTLTGFGYGRLGYPYRSQDNTALAPVTFVPAQDTYLGQPQKYVSNNTQSLTVKAVFNNSSEATSPVINLDTFSATLISNRVESINETAMEAAPTGGLIPNFVSETDTDPSLTESGSELFKYVTQNVVLANPANDLMIYFDVYNNINSDFDVYVKLVSVNSSTSIDDTPWQLIDGIDKKHYSADLTDRIEFTVTASQDMSTWVQDQQFSSFKIKLVGRALNSCTCPLFRNFRAIAVT